MGNQLTSLPLSKWLAERGFDGEAVSFWNEPPKEANCNPYRSNRELAERDMRIYGNDFYPAYDLLWDICIKYAKEIFGENDWGLGNITQCQRHGAIIMKLLQQGKKEEAEAYIMKFAIL